VQRPNQLLIGAVQSTVSKVTVQEMVTFSTIASAVKPSERSDQHLILGAMFCLNAHVEAVTAKQIKDLLELHLGNKAPTNVNASLRAYDAYVEPAEKGPPLRWHLTPEGLQALRQMSGLELAEKTNGNDFETDVGIVCALEQPEFEAIMNAMGGPEKWKVVGSPRFPHVYRQTTLTTADGRDLRVVGTTSTSMGLTAAAIVTTQLILQFRPRLVVMVGIAAGTRPPVRRRSGGGP
jgi:hypothetical protein